MTPRPGNPLLAGWADAARALRERPRSTLMCCIAIAMAVAAFSAVSGLTRGMAEMLGRRFETLGAQTVSIDVDRADARFRPTPRDVEALRRMSGVRDVALVRHLGAASLVSAGKLSRVAVVQAVSPSYFSIDRLELASGRPVDGRAGEALIGAGLARELFGTRPAVGAYVRVAGGWLRVVGIIARTNEPSKFASNDYLVIMTLQAAQSLPGFGHGSGRIVIQADEGADPKSVGARAVETLIRLDPARRGQVAIATRQDLIDDARKARRTQSLVASVAALLATVVSALGVMNMLYLAADERRTEIGLRRALGATRRDIVGMFLAESALLCALAVPVGIGVGLACAYVIKLAMGLSATPVLTGGMMAMVTVATLTAVVGASLAPAWTAARQHPVEALRAE